MTSRSPSPGCARGATSQSPIHSALSAAQRRPCHQLRRAITCATKTRRAPSSTTSHTSIGRVTASSVWNRSAVTRSADCSAQVPSEKADDGERRVRGEGSRRRLARRRIGADHEAIGRQGSRPPPRLASFYRHSIVDDRGGCRDDAPEQPVCRPIAPAADVSGSATSATCPRTSISCFTLRTKSPAARSSSSSTSSSVSPAAHAWAMARKVGSGGRVRSRPASSSMRFSSVGELGDRSPPVSHLRGGEPGCGRGLGTAVLVGEARHESGQRRRIEIVEQSRADRLGEQKVALVEDAGESLTRGSERPAVEIAPRFEYPHNSVEPPGERADPTADAFLDLLHLAGDAVSLGCGPQSILELRVAQNRVVGGVRPVARFGGAVGASGLRRARARAGVQPRAGRTAGSARTESGRSTWPTT